MPDSNPQNIDVAKLHELLGDTQEQQKIGSEVLKAVIIDVLRSKAGGIHVPWIVRHGLGGPSRVLEVLQKIVDDVSLSEEELRILKELEEGDKPQGG